MSQQYPPFFQILHDEAAPVGHLGRGTHYSVFRCVNWVDEFNVHMLVASYQTFAVVWDEDHDTRVMEAVLKLYTAGLLGSALIVGERKGSFSYLMRDDVLQNHLQAGSLDSFKNKIYEVAQPDCEDWWPAEVGSIENPRDSSIILAEAEKVRIYLENIRNLWHLGVQQERGNR